ncbi:hypothetical protein pdam_00006752 [Pocillopora damicornis]|uniref:Uncharacterized protein n=1 Tax=Pocillopora damicornis TaxID=46731 RepID=A0A3M6UVN8_POCDA|nr:hypothetical protein pdam_00006752 [Pocillopora damicornis]
MPQNDKNGILKVVVATRVMYPLERTHQRLITSQPSSSRLVSQGGPVDSLMASFQEDPEDRWTANATVYDCNGTCFASRDKQSDSKQKICDTDFVGYLPSKALKLEEPTNSEKNNFTQRDSQVREEQLLGETDHETILNTLLQNPIELNLKEKPSAIRENKLFTLDMREIPISSVEAEDNGAYISKGNAKRLFQYNSKGSRTVHKNENGAFYANKLYDMYKKPRAAGPKSSSQSKTKRVHSPEPEMVEKKTTAATGAMKFLNPDRTIKDADKSVGVRERTDKSGKIRNEAETLITSLHTLPLNSSVTFTKEQYISVNSSPNMLNDIHRFCVLGNSILRIDTNFELVDGLWLTDTTYTNESLIDQSNKHPEFPGPSFWHFKKSRESYRRFAGELIIAKPELLGIKKIGHDLDKAIAGGMTDILKDADNVWCTQHSQERDALKLKSLGANERSRNRIMTDIYGSQDDVLLHNGLADADDPEDFQIKLARLETVWESLVPGFHRWFTKHRSEQFKTCLVLSARQNLGITGRFYTNGLELKHRLQKKRLREDEIPEEVANVTSMLEKWTTEFYLEEERAVCGLGKYRLSLGYEQFQVDPVKWNRWSLERQAQHLSALRNFTPKSYEMYKKPMVTGIKSSPQSKRRRVHLPEPEIFTDRVEVGDDTPQAVTPIRITKSDDKTKWQVEKSTNAATEAMNFLDPDRISGNQYELVSRDDEKLCPKSVQRCEQCRVAFHQADKVVVKSVRVRERTDKSGKTVKYTGNLYLHFLTKCLSEYDQKFAFSAITVPTRTLTFLPEGGRAILEAKGLYVEK